MRIGILFFILSFVANTLSAQVPASLMTLYTRGDSCLSANDFSANLDLALRATAEAEATKDCRWISESYRRVGIAYDYLKNKEQAWRWLYASLSTLNDCADADTIRMRTTRYLGAMFYGIQQGDSSIYYLSQSADLMLQYGYYAEAASAYGMTGEAYSTIVRDTAKARQNYLESIRLARKSKEQYALGFALFRYGCHLARNGACEYGRPFIDSSYIVFKQLNSTEGIKWALNGIAYAESQCGSASEVYNYLTLVQRITDSLFHVETAQQAAHYEALYEKEKQDREILSLEQRTRNQRIYILAIIALTIMLGAIAWLIVNRRNLRNKQQADLLLHQAQLNNFREVLEAENNERQRIATELHDSLGQILSSVRMHISMIDHSIPNVEKTNDLLDEAAKEVRHISHNLMPASLTELGLTAALRQTIRTMSPDGVPEILLQCDAYQGASEKQEVFLYRIVQELLTNSIKHGRAQQIKITLLSNNTSIQLEVIDNGVGFDPQQLQNAPGIGMKNIKTRIDLLNGSLLIDSTIGKGSKFNIILPK